MSEQHHVPDDGVLRPLLGVERQMAKTMFHMHLHLRCIPTYVLYLSCLLLCPLTVYIEKAMRTALLTHPHINPIELHSLRK